MNKFQSTPSHNGSTVVLSYQGAHGQELNPLKGMIIELFRGLSEMVDLSAAEVRVFIFSVGPKGGLNKRGIRIRGTQEGSVYGDLIIEQYCFRFTLAVSTVLTPEELRNKILSANRRQRFIADEELFQSMHAARNGVVKNKNTGICGTKKKKVGMNMVGMSGQIVANGHSGSQLRRHRKKYPVNHWRKKAKK